MTATASHTEQLADFRAELRHLDPDIQVDDSRLARALYSSDASIYRVVPAAVVHPHDEAQVRGEFATVHRLFEEIRTSGVLQQPELFTELSMGMSGDYPLALREGATLVRVGSAIFGDRA